MAKFIVVGAAGLVGANICAVLKNDHDVIAVTHDGSSYMNDVKNRRLDLTDKDNLKKIIENETPDLIVYAAGMHGVPQCAALPKDCDFKNHTTPVNLVEIADRTMVPCVYISNAYSVGYGNGDLERIPITLEDPESPESTYGKSKLQAEDFYLSRTKSGFVIRSGMLIGRGSGVKISFWEALEKFFYFSQEIKMRKDLVHSWTEASMLGEAVLKIYEKRNSTEERLFQVCSKDSASPHKVASILLEVMEYDQSLLSLLPQSATERERWSPDFNHAEKVLNTYSLEPSGSYEMDPTTGYELMGNEGYTVREMIENFISKLHT